MSICYKSFLPLRILSAQYLQEGKCFELTIGDKTCYFLSLYRSPSQSKDDFETFLENLELNLENLVQRKPFLVVGIRDFNAESSNWFCHDKTNFEGDAIENLTSQFGFHQVIKEPTRILVTSSSCIDLIFTSQPNLITESGVHSPLHSNCHHQIIFAKLNLELVHPSPYAREVWHNKDANTELIRRAVNEFNWQRAFLNTNVNEKVEIFNSTILNILSNFIPHEYVVCDDKDSPWFNKKVRALIQEKNVALKNYRNNSSNIPLKCHLKYLQTCLNASIEVAKEKYYQNTVNKLMNTQKNSKVYWSLLKMFLNNKKIPIIPLFYENSFITDFKGKAQLFNIFFSKQFFLIPNNSSLPADVN